MTKSQTDSAAETLAVYLQCSRNFRQHHLPVPDSFMDIVPPDTRVALSKHARTMRSQMEPTLKVLVCRGRYFLDYASLSSELDQLNAKPDLVIQGGAMVAERLARGWAKQNGISSHGKPDFWYTYGRQAGPIRNSEMLWLCPDIGVAFPGGRGTADIVRRCLDAGIPVLGPGR